MTLRIFVSVIFLLGISAAAFGADVWFVNALSGSLPANSSPVFVLIDNSPAVTGLGSSEAQSFALIPGTYKFEFATNTTTLGTVNSAAVSDSTYSVAIVRGSFASPVVDFVNLPVPAVVRDLGYFAFFHADSDVSGLTITVDGSLAAFNFSYGSHIAYVNLTANAQIPLQVTLTDQPLVPFLNDTIITVEQAEVQVAVVTPGPGTAFFTFRPGQVNAAGMLMSDLYSFIADTLSLFS